MLGRLVILAWLVGWSGTVAAAEPTFFDLRQAFVKADPAYVTHRKAAVDRLRPVLQQLFAREAGGEPMTCGDQIGKEVRWLIGYTIDWPRIERRTADLAAELARPTETKLPDGQTSPEGYWASCYHEPFFKLVVAYDRITDLNDAGQAPAVTPHFLDAYNGVDKLRTRFLDLLVSDIPATGVSKRRELNEVVSAIMRLVLRDRPKGYVWAPGLKDEVRRVLVDDMRDPATGYWGARFRDGAQTVATADLSVTFHIVRYLRGNVPDWPAIVDTTLAFKDRRYPQGWASEIGPLNHNLYDVAELFRLGWSKVDAARQAKMAVELKSMLDWSLTNTLQPDGSFILTSEDDSLEEAQYFGVSLLAAAGLFQPGKPYWSDQPYPGANDIRVRIDARLTALMAAGGGSTGGAYYRPALELLRN